MASIGTFIIIVRRTPVVHNMVAMQHRAGSISTYVLLPFARNIILLLVVTIVGALSRHTDFLSKASIIGILALALAMYYVVDNSS